MNKIKFIFGILIPVLLTIAINLLFPISIIEKSYLLFFSFFRKLWDASFGYFNFPLIIVFVLILLITLIRWIRKKNGWKLKLLGITKFLLWFIFLFHLLWGFNYNKTVLADQLQIPTFQPDTLELNHLIQEQIINTSVKRDLIQFDTSAITHFKNRFDIEKEARTNLSKHLLSIQYPHAGLPRCKQVSKGSLRFFGTQGFYFPFTGESYVDSSLEPFELPFTMCHELAHAYGIAPEQDASFVAYFACMNSDNIYFQYAAEYNLLLQLLGIQKLASPYSFKRSVSQLPSGIRNDIRHVKYNNQRYIVDFLNQVTNVTYEAYLQSQGQELGLNSYNHVALMIISRKSQLNALE